MLKKWKYLPKDWTLSKFARYLLHDSTDETRFDKLSETLQLAQSKNIPIFILTNNPMGSNQKNLFIEVFAELGVTLSIKHILRGGSNGPKEKGITIIQNIIPMIEKNMNKIVLLNQNKVVNLNKTIVLQKIQFRQLLIGMIEHHYIVYAINWVVKKNVQEKINVEEKRNAEEKQKKEEVIKLIQKI